MPSRGQGAAHISLKHARHDGILAMFRAFLLTATLLSLVAALSVTFPESR